MTTITWSQLRANLIASYNPIVVSFFGGAYDANGNFSSEDPNAVLGANICLIQAKDSGAMALNRQTYFYNIAKGGGNSSAIAAVPEWWQIRPEAQRPQLIILCSAVDDKNTVVGYPVYPITIPHPASTKKFTNSSIIPIYQKGNIETILTLSDNSKIIVNTIDADTATTVLTAIQKLISPDYLKNSFTKTGTRKGQELLQIKVKPTVAKFFSTGAKNMTPDWTSGLS